MSNSNRQDIIEIVILFFSILYFLNSDIIINLVVCRLNCFCWQGEDACCPVVISVAMTQKAVATVVRGNRDPK